MSDAEPPADPAEHGRRGVGPVRRPLRENAAIVVAAFVAATVAAEIAGATNLGTALSVGQIGFAIALVYVMLRR